MDNPYEPPRMEPERTGPPSGTIRPTAVTVFGILNLVFGGLGLACTPVNLMFLFMPAPPPGRNIAVDLMTSSPTYRATIIVFSVLGMAAAAVEIVAGIGLLRLRPWGRTLSLGFASYSIVAIVVGLAVNYVFLIRPLLAAARAANNPAATGGAVGGVIGGLASGVIGLIYPVLLLFFMTRPRIARAFAAKGADDPWIQPIA
ncbi:MAG TPA: hypothetical protein VF590_26515 [Isosphaeraceae bacterium]